MHSDNADSIYGVPNEAALLALMDRTGYHMIQENGQRKYGPPPDWVGNPPQRGCEIFVGKIPRDCYEDELVPAFERMGKIYEFRLMMNFSGSNRGYCFVMYTNREDARRSIAEMNNYEIRRGRYLGVCASVDNCRLFVGGIPKNKQQQEIKEEMSKVTDGIVDVIMYSSAANKSKNRGFAFVEYSSHRAAAMARRKLIPGRIQLFGHQIAVDWAKLEKDVDEDVMNGVKILYIRKLMLSTTEEELRRIFNHAAGHDNAVERVKKILDYAFIHFLDRMDAEQALRIVNGMNIDGSIVEVVFAKPVDKNSYVRYTRGTGKISPIEQRMGGSNGNSVNDLIARLPEMNISGSNFLDAPPGSAVQGRYGGSISDSISRIAPNLPPSLYMRQSIQQQQQDQTSKQGMYNMSNVGLTNLYDNGALSTTTIGDGQLCKAAVKMLEEVCIKNRWGNPSYQLHSTVGCDGSGDVQLFMFKITIPALMNVFVPTKLSTNVEKAQNIAAEHALQELGFPVEGGDASVATQLQGMVKLYQTGPGLVNQQQQGPPPSVVNSTSVSASEQSQNSVGINSTRITSTCPLPANLLQFSSMLGYRY